MAFEHIILPIRGVQALFALIILGLTAYLASVSNGYDFFGDYYHISFGQVNFMIFNSILTLLGLAYLVFCPKFAPKFAHKFALLAVDAVLTLFWFSGFIALAVILILFFGKAYGAGAAASAFGAFQWLLFVATTIMNALNVFRYNSSKNEGNNVEVHNV